VRRAAAFALLILTLAGCDKPAPDARASNPAKYDRDALACRDQVDEAMKTRREVDRTRRDVFRDDRDRYGQGALPDQMDAYADSRSSDRVMADCMEAHGWPQGNRQWWQKIGDDHKF